VKSIWWVWIWIGVSGWIKSLFGIYRQLSFEKNHRYWIDGELRAATFEWIVSKYASLRNVKLGFEVEGKGVKAAANPTIHPRGLTHEPLKLCICTYSSP
jgi:hypothetical protein